MKSRALLLLLLIYFFSSCERSEKKYLNLTKSEIKEIASQLDSISDFERTFGKPVMVEKIDKQFSHTFANSRYYGGNLEDDVPVNFSVFTEKEKIVDIWYYFGKLKIE